MQEAGELLDSNELGLRNCRFLVIPGSRPSFIVPGDLIVLLVLF